MKTLLMNIAQRLGIIRKRSRLSPEKVEERKQRQLKLTIESLKYGPREICLEEEFVEETGGKKGYVDDEALEESLRHLAKYGPRHIQLIEEKRRGYV